MSEAESPDRAHPSHEVTIDDVRQIIGASTPHFSLQVGGRLKALVSRLADDDPVRKLAEDEIDQLERLAVEGETRGLVEEYNEPLPSLRME